MQRKFSWFLHNTPPLNWFFLKTLFLAGITAWHFLTELFHWFSIFQSYVMCLHFFGDFPFFMLSAEPGCCKMAYFHTVTKSKWSSPLPPPTFPPPQPFILPVFNICLFVAGQCSALTDKEGRHIESPCGGCHGLQALCRLNGVIVRLGERGGAAHEGLGLHNSPPRDRKADTASSKKKKRKEKHK